MVGATGGAAVGDVLDDQDGRHMMDGPECGFQEVGGSHPGCRHAAHDHDAPYRLEIFQLVFFFSSLILIEFQFVILIFNFYFADAFVTAAT
jgi:hypothetical protein